MWSLSDHNVLGKPSFRLSLAGGEDLRDLRVGNEFPDSFLDLAGRQSRGGNAVVVLDLTGGEDCGVGRGGAGDQRGAEESGRGHGKNILFHFPYSFLLEGSEILTRIKNNAREIRNMKRSGAKRPTFAVI